MTYTPPLAPLLTGRVQSPRNAAVSPPPCYQSYLMRSLPLATAAHGRFPHYPEALHRLVLKTDQRLSPCLACILSTPLIDSINSEHCVVCIYVPKVDVCITVH